MIVIYKKPAHDIKEWEKKGKKGDVCLGNKGTNILNVKIRISLTIVDTPGFGDNIDNEKW